MPGTYTTASTTHPLRFEETTTGNGYIRVGNYQIGKWSSATVLGTFTQAEFDLIESVVIEPPSRLGQVVVRINFSTPLCNVGMRADLGIRAVAVGAGSDKMPGGAATNVDLFSNIARAQRVVR